MPDVKEFLNKIAQLESSGGQNVDHPEVKHGIQKGDKAIGRYGLMPNTIKEIAKRQLASGDDNVEYDLLNMLDDKQLQDYISQSPELEQKMAEFLANHVLQKTGGDEAKAAFSWNQGTNLNDEKIEKRDYLNHPYTKKFLELNKKQDGPAPASVEDAPPMSDNDSGSATFRMLKGLAKVGGQKLGSAIEAGRQGLNSGLRDLAAKAVKNADESAVDLGGGLKMDPMGMIGGIKNIAEMGLKEFAGHEIPKAIGTVMKDEAPTAISKFAGQPPVAKLAQAASEITPEMRGQFTKEIMEARAAGKPRSIPAAMESYLPENAGKIEQNLGKKPLFENKPIELKELKRSGDFPEYDIQNPELVESSMSPDTFLRQEKLEKLKKLLGK